MNLTVVVIGVMRAVASMVVIAVMLDKLVKEAPKP